MPSAQIDRRIRTYSFLCGFSLSLSVFLVRTGVFSVCSLMSVSTSLCVSRAACRVKPAALENSSPYDLFDFQVFGMAHKFMNPLQFERDVDLLRDT